MRDDVLGAIRKAVGNAFEILGEMGREGDQAVAYLARENDTGGLVALKLEKEEAEASDSDLSLTVRRQLDASVPAQSEQCAFCQAVVKTWTRFCPSCSRDLSGRGQTDNTGQEQLRAEVRRAAAGRYELLGEMPRAEGGRPVFFGRRNDTGEIVALRLDRVAEGEDKFAVSVTQMLRAVRADALGQGSARTPDVKLRDALTRPGAAQPAPPADSKAPEPGRTQAAAYFCPTCGAEYEAGVWFCPRDGSAVKPRFAGADLVGRIVAGRYRIVRKIGEGGMGQVFYAEHVRIGKAFALKIMNPAFKSDPEALGRFGREAAHASRIDHPHVAAVQDFGESEDGLIFLAMEYAQGKRLTEILAEEGALPPQRAAEIARQIADALAAAHQQSIVHRDLKPDNVIVDHRGERDVTKVVDFGIAKAIESEASQKLTRTGFVVGTPKYMSPEQLIADPVDGRSDVYSLGCILYEMLVGEPVFSAPTGEAMITRRLTEPPPSPRRKNARITKELDQIVLRAMARAPGDRFASAEEMRDALASSAAVPATRSAAASAKPAVAKARSTQRQARLAGEARAPEAGQSVLPRVWTGAGVMALLAVVVTVVALALRGPDGSETTPRSSSDQTGAPDAGPPPVVPPQTRVDTPATGPSRPVVEPTPQAPPRPTPTRETTPTRAQRDSPVVSRPVERTPPPVVPPPVPTVPSAAGVDSVRDLLTRGSGLKDSGDYGGAFGSIRSARARISTLRAAFPSAAILNTLEREHAELLRTTINACQAYRDVRISLGLPPPECTTGGNGTGR
ncbi:MAG: serine/threonine-protein kinase [Longimicrobiales bacterium]